MLVHSAVVHICVYRRGKGRARRGNRHSVGGGGLYYVCSLLWCQSAAVVCELPFLVVFLGLSSSWMSCPLCGTAVCSNFSCVQYVCRDILGMPQTLLSLCSTGILLKEAGCSVPSEQLWHSLNLQWGAISVFCKLCSRMPVVTVCMGVVQCHLPASGSSRAVGDMKFSVI
jgi:hypothetical protein